MSGEQKLKGYVFIYERARDKLMSINLAMRNRTFNPVDFSDALVRQRRFENMMERWIEQKAEEERANELSPETLKAYRSNNCRASKTICQERFP
jgi:hypothetical protein